MGKEPGHVIFSINPIEYGAILAGVNEIIKYLAPHVMTAAYTFMCIGLELAYKVSDTYQLNWDAQEQDHCVDKIVATAKQHVKEWMAESTAVPTTDTPQTSQNAPTGDSPELSTDDDTEEIVTPTDTDWN